MEEKYADELEQVKERAKTLTPEELILSWKYHYKNFNPLGNSADYIEIIEEEMERRMTRSEQ